MQQMLEATARAEDRHFWFRGLRRHAGTWLKAALPRGSAPRILDCGAGTGRNLDWLGTIGPAAGVELDPAGLAAGRAAGRRLVRASVTRLPVADASMDVVTSFDVLYCLDAEDERAAIREMFRVLRPGGLLLANVAALDVLRGAHSTLTHEVRRYTPDRLRTRLEAAGFAVVRMSFTNMATFPVALAVRVLDRLTGRAAKASDADLRVPPWPVNAAFDAGLRLEHALMRVTDLPIGSSILCLARKPDGAERVERLAPARGAGAATAATAARA
ncbi:MAG: methyltransferase domain-containing protein [Vicinamibacterales bacterium]